MSKTARPHPKPARRPTYIRVWRKHRGLTLAQLADRLQTELEVAISEGQISRIERGETPYSQDILEAFAAALAVAPDTTDPPADTAAAQQPREETGPAPWAPDSRTPPRADPTHGGSQVALPAAHGSAVPSGAAGP